MESTKNGKRNINRQRTTLKRERSTTSAVNSPQIRRKSATTVATQTPLRIRRQKSVNIPPPIKASSAKSPRIRRQKSVNIPQPSIASSAKSPQIRRQYSDHHIRRKSSTKCIEGEIITKSITNTKLKIAQPHDQ